MTEKEKLFKLLDEYKRGVSEHRMEAIITQLYNAGYIIRPLQTIIITNEVESEILNAGSTEWGLVDRRTRRPLERD